MSWYVRSMAERDTHRAQLRVAVAQCAALGALLALAGEAGRLTEDQLRGGLEALQELARRMERAT